MYYSPASRVPVSLAAPCCLLTSCSVTDRLQLLHVILLAWRGFCSSFQLMIKRICSWPRKSIWILGAGLKQSGLLYYNNMLSLPLMTSYMLLCTNEVQEATKLPQLRDPQFLVRSLEWPFTFYLVYSFNASYQGKYLLLEVRALVCAIILRSIQYCIYSSTKQGLPMIGSHPLELLT